MSVVQLHELLMQYLVPVLGAMGVLIFLLLIWVIIISKKASRAARNYHSLMRGMNDRNLEEMLTENIKKVRIALDRTDEIELACKKLEASFKSCLQNTGIVRFNAFDYVGSDLSFSVALLDHQGDGVVISGLYGRDDCRTYAKPIKAGQSSYLLTAEEKEAIHQALSKRKA